MEQLPILVDRQAKQIAEDIANEFYQYGLSLQYKERISTQIPQNTHLWEQDKAKLDEWILGRDIYQRRLSRLGDNPTEEQVNNLRNKLFSVFFEALNRKWHRADTSKPWETIKGPIQHLHDRTRMQITRAIEMPKREMQTAIFRRGVEKLITEMKIPFWKKNYYPEKNIMIN